MDRLNQSEIGAAILKSFFIAAFITGIAGIIAIYNTARIAAAGAAHSGSGNAVLIIIITVIAEIVITVILGIKTARNTAEPAEVFMNQIMENMKEKSKAVQRVASGDLDFELKPRSGHDIFAESINRIIAALKGLASETESLSETIQNGDIDHRADTEKFCGGYKEIIISINQVTSALICPIQVSNEYFERISKGDIPEKIEIAAKGNFGKLNQSINACIDSINTLAEDSGKLCSEAEKGNLSFRSDITRCEGIYIKILEGINRTLDSVIHPLQIASSHMAQIGRGEIPEKITVEYQGEFNSIKDSINSCIDGLNCLKEGKLALERMKDNDYTAKVEGSCQGIFGEITESINMISYRILHIVDILGKISDGNLEDLPRLKNEGKKCENDALSPAVVALMECIKALADETHTLSAAAVEGKLSKRGQPEKFKGEYAAIIQGFNQTLDAVTKSAYEVITVLKEVANGNLHTSVKGDYQGDHSAIKNAINETIDILRDYVKEISNVLSAISSRTLDVEITMEHKGDFSEIGDSLNEIVGTLNQVMGDFSNAAEQVSSGSRQVSDGSQSLAQGSTEQASSIQELTAAISEVAEQSKDNAIKANEVYQLAKGARDGGAKGNETMNEMLKSMKEINDSSINISKIIKVIDDIAFQTNILALNAAVEAARAGSHGKGFAVVAEEVRNLAARSAKAAEETTELIEGSIQKVQVGTKITNEIAAVLKEIADGAVISTEKLSIIAKASNEQATGIAQINQGIEQISRVIQSNSATAEQSAAASEELSGQAELLKEMVSTFKIKGRSENAALLPASNSQFEPSKIDLNRNEYDKY